MWSNRPCDCYEGFELMMKKKTTLLKQAKSLYISRAVSKFHGTEFQIWAGSGHVGSTEKKNWANYEQFLWAFFFHVFMSKKNKFEYGSVRTKKLHNMYLFYI
jgi:hypothetical protein